MTPRPTRRTSARGASRTRSSTNAKSATRSRSKNNQKRGKPKTTSSGRKRKAVAGKPSAPPATSLARIYVRAGLVVCVLLVVNILYFRRHSELFASLVPRAASIGSSRAMRFGQVPEDACERSPAAMIRSMDSLIAVSARIGGEDPVRGALARMGLDEESIEGVQKALSSVIDPSLLRDRQYPFRLRMDPQRKVQGFELELESGHLVQLCRAQGDGKLKARNLQLRPGIKTTLVSLRLDGSASLGTAARQAKEGLELAQRLGTLLRSELDPLTDLRPGDRIELIVEKRTVQDEFHRYGRVLAFSFRGAAGKFRYFYRKTSTGELAYYDAAGRPMRRRYLKTPTPWYFAGARGGRARPAEQVLRERRRGAEYRRPAGLPVYAVTDLTVSSLAKDPALGAVIETVDQAGRMLRWSGLAGPLPSLRRGDVVAQGELLGYVGPALGERAPRLRLELRDKDGAWVYLPDFLSRGQQGGADTRIGEVLGPQALADHRRAIMPWLKSLAQASRS